MREIFVTFLRLGLTSFGGPIAHLGYFRREFVERRRWLGDDAFAQIVAFCSILPGPTSSQVGLVVGTLRGGAAGAALAWLGFTLPSAVALCAFALGLRALESADGTPHWLAGALAGLTAAATAVVAQAVLALARTQCPDRPTQTIALGAAVLALALSGGSLQWVPIAAGAAAGALLLRRTLRDVAPLPLRVPRWASACSALAFVLIVAAAALAAGTSPAASLAATLVRAGSLVFGGGHVVLPLLQSAVTGGLISGRDFFAGYGAAQAVPGPLFTFAAFLGTANRSALRGIPGALVATVLVFLPSFLLVFALVPVWNGVRGVPAMGGALRGANAAVTGVLGAVLSTPMIAGLGASTPRVAIALVAFALIAVWKLPPWTVVAGAAALGAALATVVPGA